MCRLDAARICVGCGRYIDEIVEWPAADAARKRAIVAAARRRLPIIHASEKPDRT